MAHYNSARTTKIYTIQDCHARLSNKRNMKYCPMTANYEGLGLLGTPKIFGHSIINSAEGMGVLLDSVAFGR